jgi:hypothetical protein
MGSVYIEELHNLYSLISIIGMSKRRKKCSTHEMRNVYKTVAGNPERKMPLWRQRCKWEDKKKYIEVNKL